MRRTVHETSGPTVLLFVHLSRPTRVWSHFSSRPSRDVERSVVGERASVGSRRSVSCFPPTRPGLCSCAALPPMVCAERSASREVQLMPLCYYYVCSTLIPLAQGDYLAVSLSTHHMVVILHSTGRDFVCACGLAMLQPC